MISEVDLRDWEQVDFSLIERAEVEREWSLAYANLYAFALQVISLRDKQIKAVQKQLPALLKGKE